MRPVEDHGRWQGKSFIAGSQDQRRRQVASGRRPADNDLAWVALVQEDPVGRKAVIERRGERVVGRHPVVHRPRANSDRVRRGDRGPLAQVATPENPGAAVDVEEHSGVVFRDAVWRHHVERARPDVALGPGCGP